MRNLTVRHRTVYRYKRTVSLGDHRLMIRPRDSHDLRLVATELALSPPGTIRWIHDVFGNSVALVTFYVPTTELHIESVLRLERYSPAAPLFQLNEAAKAYPFIYSPDDRSDLGRTLEPHYLDRSDALVAWAKGFVIGRPTDTLELLARINSAIKTEFRYEARDEEGTQAPQTTLEKGSGSCRDLALLLMEAVRTLGFGARFVSGYLYDPMVDEGSDELVKGGGATHAWADIYLPGAGWVEYDPTNGSIGGENLIRVAVTRDPGQAVPISGSFHGDVEDYGGMTVEVTVTRENRLEQASIG